MPDARPRRRARRRRLLAAATALVIVAAGSTAWALTRTSGPTYRVASVQYADVAETVDSVGTLGAVNQAAVSFPISGQVATVPVAVGQAVSAGQVLATLSTGTLDQQLTQANQALANDQQRLADDQAGQTSPTSTTTSTTTASAGTTAIGTDSAFERPLSPTSGPTTTNPTTGTRSPSAPSSLSAATAAVRQAQAALSADQKALDAILTDDSLHDLLALTDPSGACAAAPSATQLTATTDASGTITVTTPEQAAVTAGNATVGAPVQASGGYQYTITGTPGTSYPVTITTQVIDAATCSAAIQRLVTAVDPSPDGSAWSLAQAVSGDELRLQAAISALEQAAAKAGSTGSGAGRSTARTGTTGTTGSTAHAGSGINGTSSTARPSSQPATPQQLAADQAAVDSASAQVAVARQNMAEATITSPIAGTVEDIALAVGANAGSNAITVVGAGAHEVSTTVPLADIDLVKVGDRATVFVDGVPTALTGRVSAIGVLASTTGSITSYPVTVLLDPASARLFVGAGAAVTIAVAAVTHVLSVPSSAVHSLGRISTVTVLSGGTTKLTPVGVGVVGTDRTQITSGLTAGQQVVLAQLDAPLPSSTNPLAGLRGTGLGGRAGRFATRPGG